MDILKQFFSPLVNFFSCRVHTIFMMQRSYVEVLRVNILVSLNRKIKGLNKVALGQKLSVENVWRPLLTGNKAGMEALLYPLLEPFGQVILIVNSYMLLYTIAYICIILYTLKRF